MTSVCETVSRTDNIDFRGGSARRRGGGGGGGGVAGEREEGNSG